MKEKSQHSRQQCDNSVLAPKRGAEALAIVLQLIFDEWTPRTLDTPLAGMKVDEKYFEMIAWRAVWNSASSRLTKHAAVAGWKHQTDSHQRLWIVARKKDVGGPLESSLPFGVAAAEARLHIAVQEAARTLSWISTHDPVDEQRLQDEQNSKMQRIRDFQLGSTRKLTGADDPLQENGSLTDQWHGDIYVTPVLVLSYLQALDTENAKIGAERNPQKTDVIVVRRKHGRSCF